MQDINFKKAIRIALPVILLIVFTLVLNKLVISNPDAIRQWLDGFGGYAVIAYIIIQSLAIIIAPIGGSAFALAILALFGPLKGTFIVYLVTTPIYVVNFLLARKYGKNVVQKLVGVDGEALVDKFMKNLDTKKLVFMKLFLGGYFDYIAYAVGLSTVSVKNFLIINFIAGVPSAIFTWSVMRFSPSFTFAVAAFYIVPAAIGFIYIGLMRFGKKIKKEEILLEHEI